LLDKPIVAQEVKVTLSITVKTNKNKQNSPVQTFDISMTRAGESFAGEPLPEIKASVADGQLNTDKDKTSSKFTFKDGTLMRPGTAFQLTGKPHQVIINAAGFGQIPPKDISDDELKAVAKSASKIISIPIELTKFPLADAVVTGSFLRVEDGTWIAEFKPYLSMLKILFLLLGLTGLFVFAVWVVLLILAKILRAHSFEERMVRIAPLFARSLVWPFGFRVGFSINHKDTLPHSVGILRIINEGLIQLRKPPHSATAIPRREPRDIVSNLAELVGPNIEAAGIQKYLDSIEDSLIELSNRKPATEAPEDDSLKSTLKDAVNEALLEGGFLPQKPAGDEKTTPLPEETTASESHPTRSAPNDEPRAKAAHTRAKAAYTSLLNHQQLECKPVFLETDAKSSILGKLADDNVYLLQVGSSQAPFVLFIDDNEDERTGWVFPNPAQGFDKLTLEDVFPNLGETQFNDAKAGIKPVPVTKVDERRWRVERNSLVL